jgi:hypothetical protein
MKNLWDLSLAAAFFALGLFVFIEASRLPAGLGLMPGPGFFPQLVSVLMMILAASVAAPAVFGTSVSPVTIQNKVTVWSILLLVFAYIALWGTGGFAVRTAVFLVILLKVLGERWVSAIVVAVAISAGIVLGFSYGLRLSLE